MYLVAHYYPCTRGPSDDDEAVKALDGYGAEFVCVKTFGRLRSLYFWLADGLHSAARDLGRAGFATEILP